MKEFKVIIAGSRQFNDYELLEKRMLQLFGSTPIDVIISGHAKGADTLGEKYAKDYGVKLEIYPADWNKYGKYAGYLRNEIMANHGDVLVAFWNGESKGTKHMINIALEKGLEVHVIRVD